MLLAAVYAQVDVGHHVAGALPEAADRLARRDLAVPRHDLVRAELRLRAVPAAGQAVADRRARSVELARRRLRRRADSRRHAASVRRALRAGRLQRVELRAELRPGRALAGRRASAATGSRSTRSIRAGWSASRGPSRSPIAARRPCASSAAAVRFRSTSSGSSTRTAAACPSGTSAGSSRAARRSWPATSRTRRRRAETLRDGWLHTGDLGYIADGELFVCGRTKDLIIRHGRKYHPPDLESAIADVDGHPAVRRRRLRHQPARMKPTRSWPSSKRAPA